MRKNKPPVEKRTYTLIAIEVRADDKASSISGYAAIFDSPADIAGFREVIRRGAFSEATKAGADVRALWNHDTSKVLGRTTNGTLTLSEDDKGLRVEVEPPNTTWGKDALASIKRGDVSGMSFAFRTVDDRWSVSDGQDLRELLKVELFEVSPVAFPSYEETTVSARELWAMRQADKQEEHPVKVEAGESVEMLRLRLNLLEIE